MPVFSFENAKLTPTSAHAGIGHVEAETVRSRLSGSQINFLDLVILPPGNSVGLHTHANNDEEIYIIIDGTGLMTIDGTQTRVGPGHAIVNPAGGTHGLEADTNCEIRFIVIDVSTDGSAYKTPLNCS